jgi:hypothetical protein
MLNSRIPCPQRQGILVLFSHLIVRIEFSEQFAVGLGKRLSNLCKGHIELKRSNAVDTCRFDGISHWEETAPLDSRVVILKPMPRMPSG